MATTKRSDQDGPPMVFDGEIFWYREYFDPADDRCCRCRELIPEEEVPLILWKKDTRNGETHMARLHFWCGQPLLQRVLRAR